MKRILDVLLSLLGLILLTPLLLLFSLIIVLTSKGGVFFKQIRIGKNGKEFTIYKFRTMHKNNSNNDLLTIGNDKRITSFGKILRATKLDELPQLFNIIIGDMSLVGPRPEVKEYVNLYTAAQRKVLEVKPGLTDYASIKFLDEAKILATFSNPKQAYINEIMPEKIRINLAYLQKRTLFTDVKVLFLTVLKIVF